MQRYHGASCASAVNNNSIGGASVRDTTRADSSSLPTNFSINSRRSSLLTPYKLKCDKESLNSRLGPPDFHPQTPNCPEENLTREYVQSGYRETVEGLEEAREISVTQVPAFSKPLVVKCKDAIRKRLRAINESRAQKRKAGQVYGVPLSGSLLTKPGVFPEQRPCGEDFRKKWIEGLSQQHKRLRSLADNVPHGYRKKTLFEVLIRNNVPLLRATWFIKITYLNQVRTSSASISSGAPDKTQYLRTELWTNDVIDYLQLLMDDFFSRNNALSNPHSRDRSPQMFYTGSLQQKGDSSSAVLDGEEPSLYFKWWYMVRLLHWHQAEGILLPSLIIDWVLAQLQDKDLFEILQLLLPIIYGVLETVVLSQTYVRSLVGIAIRFIRESSPGGSDPVHNSRRAYTTSGLVEMLRYLILAVPDTFVALNCFPLPHCVISYSVNDGNFVLKAHEDATELKYSLAEVSRLCSSKDVDVQYQSLALNNVISSIQKSADNLSKTANPEFSSHSVAKAIQALDKSLSLGDIHGAYKYLFKDFCDGVVNEGWIGEVSPCLRSSLKWFRTVSTSFVCSVFSLCEWATCDFRDFRTAAPNEVKFTGGMDFSQVYIAVWLLKLKLGELQGLSQHKHESTVGANTMVKAISLHNNLLGRPLGGSICEPKNSAKTVDGRSMNSSKIFDSPGPLHDIIVCWIDQHEVQKGEGLKRLQLLIAELITAGIFYPHSYVRQLMVSGIMDINGSTVDANRWKRHHRILKQLPKRFIHNALEETEIAQGPKLLEVMQVYSNERRFMLHDFINDRADFHDTNRESTQQGPHNQTSGKDGISAVSVNQMKAHLSSYLDSSSKKIKHDANVEELKETISVLLHFPNNFSTFTDVGMCESPGSVKRSFVSVRSKMDVADGTSSCEECRRAKKQKTSEDKSSCSNDHSSSLSDDEDMWWMRKEPKSLESVKVDPPLKSTKQVSKSRQKVVRKTQSLAQLAATRIEGSQGASTSHVCDNKVTCPHHKTGIEETSKPDDGFRTNCGADILLIGKDLKRLHFVEKRALTSWLVMVIKQLLEETEKTIAKPGQFGRPFTSGDDRSSTRWKLREDELSLILYLMDICNDLVSAVKFLLWLLPKVHRSPNSSINSRRNALLVPRTVENQVCEVGEAYLLSSLRRYENILVSTDLIPEALSVIINRATSIMASNGRISGSAALHYAKYLLKKYSNVISVIEWEKSFKATCDKRLVSELDSGSSMDGESGFSLGVAAGVDDLDDFFRQKIGGNRLSRVGMGMRDLVQRQFDDAFHFLFGKERKLFSGGSLKGPAVDKSDDGYQIAQGIITGLMDCIRQTGGAAQEGDPSLVSSAVSAVIGNVGIAVSKMPDFLAGSGSSLSSSTSSLSFTRRILQIHITCLCLLKEALGERQSRVFEIALAAEASSALAGVFPSGKASRSQLQSLADSHDSTSNISTENMKSVGKATKIAVAVSALVVGAVIHGVTSLERLVTVFRLKEGLDFIHFVRNSMLNSNGNARSVGGFKIENSVEVYLHWFRLLVGNCRSIFDGMIVELLGEPSVVALSRMQRLLPLSLVFPPSYSIFAFVMWRPFVLNATLAAREDTNQLYQSLMIAIGDVIRHSPFRDVCLRDCQSFYDLVAADTSDGEFAALLDLNGSELHIKSMAFVPLRARLFLNAIIDCKLPSFVYTHEDGNRGLGDYKIQFGESKTKLLDRLIHVLDTIQPAKFHWQWVELRLLLNEQALIEKLETHDMPLANAIRLSSPSLEKAAASDNENNFIEIILTRLLVRPDAAPLFSDVIHLFGQSLGDSMLLHAKWFLGGVNVLFGRLSIRQRLINIAENKGFLIKPQFWKPWGWCNSVSDPSTSKGEKKKFEISYIEEGEVIDEGMELRRCGKGSAQTFDSEGGSNASLQHETETALIDLILPCIDQSSDDSRNTFASDLIKQLNNIEQQINAVSRGVSKQTGTAPSGIEGPTNKGNSRKAMKGGSPGLSRRSTGSPDLAPLSPAALRASMSLRLQLLLRLLPVIRADREPSGRNMRHMLASVILRLLGNRVVHEDSVLTLSSNNSSIAKKELVESSLKVSPTTAFLDISGESLFDQLLLVLHGLLSSCEPSWLRSKSAIKSTSESIKEFTALDRELVESLQSDLNLMQLPDTIRLRIQAAMPILLPSVRCFISCHPPCHPPTFPFSAVASLYPSTMFPMFGSAHQGNKAPSPRIVTHIPGKSKSMTLQDNYPEIDPWTVLEDGAGSNHSSSSTALIGGGDHTNLRASNLLKGAVRIRRTELTYIGAVDDYS